MGSICKGKLEATFSTPHRLRQEHTRLGIGDASYTATDPTEHDKIKPLHTCGARPNSNIGYCPAREPSYGSTRRRIASPTLSVWGEGKAPGNQHHLIQAASFASSPGSCPPPQNPTITMVNGKSDVQSSQNGFDPHHRSTATVNPRLPQIPLPLYEDTLNQHQQCLLTRRPPRAMPLAYKHQTSNAEHLPPTNCRNALQTTAMFSI